MSMEMPEIDKGPDKEKKREVASKRLMLALEAATRLSAKEVKVEGKENLDAIPLDKKVIFVTSHISDVDVPIAALTAGKYFDIAIADLGSNHSLYENPGVAAGLRVAGIENFLPIDHKKVEGRRYLSFNPENFEPMKNVLDSGKALVIAGHNPAKKNWELSEGGYGAVYLYDVTDNSVLVPISVNLESETQIGMAETPIKNVMERPDASVYIGEPFEPEKIPHMEDIAEIMDKRSRGEALTSGERARFSELHEALRAQSDAVMERIATPLPEAKRGKYGKSEI